MSFVERNPEDFILSWNFARKLVEKAKREKKGYQVNLLEEYMEKLDLSYCDKARILNHFYNTWNNT